MREALLQAARFASAALLALTGAIAGAGEPAGTAAAAARAPASLDAARSALRTLVPDAQDLLPAPEHHYGRVPRAEELPDPLKICGQVVDSHARTRIKRRRCFMAQDLPPGEVRDTLFALQAAMTADAQAASPPDR